MFGSFKTRCGEIVKGAIVALFIMLASVLIFAFVLKVASLPGSVVRPVNQFIRTVAVFLGCLVSVKEEKGALKGAAVGMVSAAFSSLIFCLIGKEWIAFLSFFIDLSVAVAVGAISGIIAVNSRGK